MSTTLILTIGTGPAGAGVALWGAGAAPATGQLAPDAAATADQAVAAALQTPPGLLLAGSDVDSAARERRAGEALGHLLDAPAMQPIRDALVSARARDPDLVLAIDARTHTLRDLPWELLAGLPPGRSPLGVAAVIRLSAHEPKPTPPPVDGLELRLWAPQTDDPVVADIVTEVRALADAEPRLSLVELPADLSAAAPPAGWPDGRPAVLHVVTHGQAVGAGAKAGLAGVGLASAERVQAPETAARTLAPWLEGCVLAIADVCAGAATVDDVADSPAWRLALTGVPAVVGPRTRWAVEASAAFRIGLLSALLAGDPLLSAIEAGRGRLRSLAVAHESCRWWTPLTIVATPLAAGIRVLRPTARVPGWPPADPALAPVLRHALDHATGYVGAEHLLASLAHVPAALPPALVPLVPALRAAAERCPPQPLAGPPTPTPRLRALGQLLPDGFGPAELAQALAVVPWIAAALDPAARARILAPPGDDGRGTLPLEHDLPAPHTGAGLAFEVEGGPEDGRILTLDQPGDVLGRWDPGRPADTHGRLYAGRSDADRTLSRRHLVVVADREVELRGASRLGRGAGPLQPARGRVSLEPGDRLLLGASTRLRVC